MATSSSSDIKCGVYDVNLPARAIAPIHDTAGGKQSHFLVGSCAANDGATKNQLCVLSYGEDRKDVNCSAVINHDGEIISIATPANAATTDDVLGGGSVAQLFSTTHTTSLAPNDITSTIFKLVPTAEGTKTEVICEFPAGTSAIAWHPLKLDSNEVRVVLSENEIALCEIDAASVGREPKIVAKYQLPNITSQIASGALPVNRRINTLLEPTLISWDPIYNERIIAAKGTSLYQIDIRSRTGASASGSSVLLCSGAHGFGSIRTLHSNRNELNLLATGGDDGMVSFWDLRKCGNGPLLSQRVHDHNVQKICFNRMSDKTLLTCSSDRSAKLWHFGDSAPWGSAAQTASPARGGVTSPLTTPPALGNLQGNTITSASLGEFGDSVMDACWSSLTPFVTAAVSYNGKVIIGTVSKTSRESICGT